MTAEGIRKIVDVINNVKTISIAISGAVEEQSAATNEVASNIFNVQEAAAQTGQTSTEMLDVATDLSTRAEELKKRVNEFLSNVRSM